jgi:hypothetical protein
MNYKMLKFFFVLLLIIFSVSIIGCIDKETEEKKEVVKDKVFNQTTEQSKVKIELVDTNWYYYDVLYTNNDDRSLTINVKIDNDSDYTIAYGNYKLKYKSSTWEGSFSEPIAPGEFKVTSGKFNFDGVLFGSTGPDEQDLSVELSKVQFDK